MLQLEEQLADKRVMLVMEESPRQWLAQHGHDPTMGARPMSRLIRERINQALADELLFGKLIAGGNVRVYVEDDNLAFDIESLAKH